MFSHKHHHKDGQDADMTDATGTATSGAAVQRVTNQAALVQENVINKDNVNLQDVVTRDVEKTEVRQIVQPIHETQQNAPLMHEQTLPTQHKEINNDRGVAPIAVPVGTRTEEQVCGQRTVNAPIIQERVHHKIIEEIQPVVTRDVIQEHQVLVKQPIHEHIVEAPVVTTTTAPTIERASGLPPSTVNTTNYQAGAACGVIGSEHGTEHHHHHDASHGTEHHSTHTHEGGSQMHHHSAAVRGAIPTTGAQQQTTGTAIHQTLHGDLPGNQRLVEQHQIGGNPLAAKASGVTGTGQAH